MPLLEFISYEPDKADSANPVNLANNVFPAAAGFKSAPSFSEFTVALAERPLGAIVTKDASGNTFNFVGTATTLQQLSSGSTWTDVSQATYTTVDPDVWEFAVWKNKVLATNFADDPQQITLGGAAFSDLTTALKAKHIGIVRSFVVFGDTTDTTDGHVPFRVRWSGFDDETDYTVSPVTQSDFQDLQGGGKVQRVIGGEYGVIFQERAIWRMQFAGPPVVFQFDQILTNKGTAAPQSVIKEGNLIFYLSQDGFEVVENGSSTRQLGVGRVNKTFYNDLDRENIHRVVGVADSNSTRILWAYPSVGSTDGNPDKVIIYDYGLDKWTTMDVAVGLFTTAASTGVSLDDLDTINASHGDELVSNGTFASGSNWTLSGGWSIGGGNASHADGTLQPPNTNITITGKAPTVSVAV